MKNGSPNCSPSARTRMCRRLTILPSGHRTPSGYAPWKQTIWAPPRARWGCRLHRRLDTKQATKNTQHLGGGWGGWGEEWKWMRVRPPHLRSGSISLSPLPPIPTPTPPPTTPTMSSVLNSSMMTNLTNLVQVRLTQCAMGATDAGGCASPPTYALHSQPAPDTTIRLHACARCVTAPQPPPLLPRPLHSSARTRSRLRARLSRASVRTPSTLPPRRRVRVGCAWAGRVTIVVNAST